MAKQQTRSHLAGRELQARFERIPRPGPIAGLLQRLAQFECGGGIVGTYFASPLQVDSGFGEISASKFKLAQLPERGRRVPVELQRLFQELARVTRSIVVAGQHGIVQQVLNFDFVFGIRQSFSTLARVARRRELGLPLRHLGLHGLKFRDVRSIKILQLLRISLQVIKFGPRSFNQLCVLRTQGAQRGPSPTERIVSLPKELATCGRWLINEGQQRFAIQLCRSGHARRGKNRRKNVSGAHLRINHCSVMSDCWSF